MSLQCDPIDFRGTPCLRLRREDASAIVALHGAQVLSWIPTDGRERLFLGERARFGSGQAIRGGIPVVFPQFAERGALRRHGFARLLDWAFTGAEGDAACFELRDGAATGEWPHAFGCRIAVALGVSTLCVRLDVENIGDAPFDFTAALHTYLRVDDIDGATLEGLQGCDYEDSTEGGVLRRENDGVIGFKGEVDRIYGDVVAPLSLSDGGHELQVEQDGFTDVVVWNPGATLAASIGDLAPGEYRQFVCVEAGQVLQPVFLPPGERWSASQTLG